jgi:hypothetical protein
MDHSCTLRCPTFAASLLLRSLLWRPQKERNQPEWRRRSARLRVKVRVQNKPRLAAGGVPMGASVLTLPSGARRAQRQRSSASGAHPNHGSGRCAGRSRLYPQQSLKTSLMESQSRGQCRLPGRLCTRRSFGVTVGGGRRGRRAGCVTRGAAAIALPSSGGTVPLSYSAFARCCVRQRQRHSAFWL